MKELFLPAAVLLVLASMLLPLPAAVLDFLLVINLLLAVTLLVSSLSITEPLKLSALPTFLLLATLFRLSLNISTTRLILSGVDVGAVIESFGRVVIQGNLIVGAVIFLVITLIQFIVIAKGSERVAEVSARFTLDALPGKQMSIDADVRAGLIDFHTAKRKREELQTESRFYGALDGAMKFVKGDAIAGLIITAINVIGGFTLGLAVLGLDFQTALSRFTLLTIGDGLLSQIPALLNSLAAGIVVTRVTKENPVSLSTELLAQLSQSRTVQFIVGGTALVFGLVPGLPFLPFVVLGSLLIVLAFLFPAATLPVRTQETPIIFQPLPPSLLAIEAPLALLQSWREGAEARRKLHQFQERIFQETGLVLPPIQLRELPESGSEEPGGLGQTEMNLSRNEQRFALLIRGVRCQEGSLDPEEQNPLGVLLEMMHSFILQARVELVDDIMTRRALDFLDETAPELVSSVVPNIVSITQLTVVLRSLSEEEVNIRNLDLILQAVAEHGARVSSERELLEEVRITLRRQLSESGNGIDFSKAIALSPELDMLLQRMEYGEEGSSLELRQALKNTLISGVETLSHTSPILCSRRARRFLFDMLKLVREKPKVLAYEELLESVDVQFVRTLNFSEGESHASHARLAA